MALTSAKRSGRGLASVRLVAYCWLSLLTCLLAACQMPGSVRQGEGPLLVEGLDRLQFPGWAKALAFSQGGRTLMAGGCEVSRDGEAPCARGLVSLWNFKDMTLEATFRFPKTVTAMAVSPDGANWVAGDSEGRLILSTKAAQGVSPRSFHQNGEITALAFSPNGQWVASGSLDASFPLGLMEMKTGGVIKVKAQFEPVSAVAFARDGKTLGVGMQNGSVVTWPFTSRESPSPIAADGGAKRPIFSLAFSPDDRFLAYGRQDGRVVIVDRASGQVTLDIRRSSAVTALAFSPNGRYLALGQDNGKVTLIESEGGQEIWSKRHIISVADVAYAPDGMSLAVAVQQGIFIYQLGDPDSTPGSLPQTERMTKTNSQYMVAPNPRQARSRDVSSRKFSRVLQVSQDEYVWLLPFDRLIVSSVEAMQRAVPGAVIEQGGSTMPGQLRLAAGGRSLSIDLNRLRQAEGRAGLREAVQAYESAQRVLLAAWPGAATALEDAAVSAVLSELGPGVRLVSEPEASAATARNSEKRNAAGTHSSSTGMSDAKSVLLSGKVAYLKLSQFSSQTAMHVREWVAKITGLPRPVEAMIVDLRDNSSDDFELATAAAMQLMPRGHLITRVIARKTGDGMDVRSAGTVGLPGNLVVLVNESTAGAAEMLACAIRTSGRGVLVGTRTAGVDDIYTTFPLPGGEGLRVSTGRFICPDDRSVRWTGQAVDVETNQKRVLGAIPMGLSHAESPMALAKWVNPFVSNLPLSDDRTLHMGLEVALCLARSSSHQHPPATTKGHTGELSQALKLCR